jgi:putative flippase GtrA
VISNVIQRIQPGLERVKQEISCTENRKQFFRYLISGFSAVGIDTFGYFTSYSVIGHNPAKTISFIAGSLMAFLMNKYFTFKKRQLSWVEAMKFLVLYISTLGANVGTNASIVSLDNKSRVVIILAFLIASGLSTMLNFIGQKYWVFKK